MCANVCLFFKIEDPKSTEKIRTNKPQRKKKRKSEKNQMRKRNEEEIKETVNTMKV